MSSFPTDQVAVTLTGEEWTTITGGLSRHGSRFYRQATAKLREQLLAASDAAQSAPPAARPPSSAAPEAAPCVVRVAPGAERTTSLAMVPLSASATRSFRKHGSAN
jgi:hypothetical protein